MRVLVTGGTGSVGINIVRRLAAQGHEVLCMSRRADEADPLRDQFLAPVHERITLVGGDVGDLKSMTSLWEEYHPTHVVHAAAITPTPEMERTLGARIMQANLMGTVNILEAAAHYGTKRVIYIGSAAVYGDGEEHPPISEGAPLQVSGLYGIAKEASEKLCRHYSKLFDLDTVSLRVGWVFGPMERPLPGSRHNVSLIHEFVRMALAGEEIRIAHLDPVRDWIHGDDLGLAVELLLEQEHLQNEVYNLAGERGYSHREVLETLQTFLPVKFRQVEPGEANISPGLSRKRRAPVSVELLRQQTGFRPAYTLASGLRQYVDWVRAQPASKM